MKILKRTLVVLLLLFVGLVLFVSVPAVQTYFGSYATKRINKAFGTEIIVKKVGLQFNGDIELKNVLIRDHKNDTLISINELNSSIMSFTKINKNHLIFTDIDIYGLYFHIKTYHMDQLSNLDIFVRKFKKDRPKWKAPFELSSYELNVYDSHFKLTNENKKSPTVLDFKKLNFEADNFLIKGPDVRANINALSFKDQTGVELRNLYTQFTYTLNLMKFENLKINTAQSKFEGTLAFLYKRGDFKSFSKKVKLFGSFDNSQINLGELNLFYPEFGANKSVFFSAEYHGTLDALEVRDLVLESNGGTKINGDFNFTNLSTNESDPFGMQVSFTNLASNYKDLKGILPRDLGQKLPSALDFLGLFSAQGKLNISNQKIAIDFDIHTDLGSIATDFIIDNVKDIDAADYNGQLQLTNFDLGSFMQNSVLGFVDTNLKMKGEGFKIENIRTDVEGSFKRLQYNDYNYKNLQVLGVIENRIFSGQLKANDNNLKLDFEGLVDFSSVENIYDFSANIQRANLKALNFIKRDSISVFSGNIAMDMRGTNLDDLYGSFQFKNTRYMNQNDSYYFEDFQVLSSFDSKQIRSISFDSPEIIDGTFEGIFKIKEIPLMVENALSGIYSNMMVNQISSGQSLEFNFKLYNKIIEVIYPSLEFGANTFFKGVLNSDPNKFKLIFKSPEIRMESFFAKKVEIKFDNNNPIFNSYVELDSLSTPYFKANEFSLINLNLNDTLYIKTQFKGGKRKQDIYDFNMFATSDNENYVLGLKPSFANFKRNVWTLSPGERTNNKFIFSPKSKAFVMDPIALTCEDEKITFRANAKDSLSTNIAIEFENVDLAKVAPEIDSLSLGGTINGQFNVSKNIDTYLPKSQLYIENFTVNTFNLGDFDALIKGNSSFTNYDVNLKIQDDLNESFSAKGNVDFSAENSNLDIDMNFKDFILKPLNPLGGDVIKDIRGKVSGTSKISGRLEKPQINGQLVLDQAGISIPYLNVDYDFEDNTKVKLERQNFIFEAANISDSSFSSKAILSGKLSHFNFANWSMDTRIESERLLVLDTEETEESLYYGTAFVAGNIDISGPLNKLYIEANVTTSKGTIFKIPLNDREMISENSYVKFLSPEEKIQKKGGRTIKLDDIKGLDMEFNMDVTDDAEIEIVIDRETGSSILGRGNGSILAQINTNDKFQMFGDFLLLSGYYNYSLGKIIQKKFKLVKDGTLLWEGNPLKAEINIEAIYDGINVNPSTLLDNPINQSIPAEVIVNLTGALEKPDLDFDIRFPKINSTLNNELRDRLRGSDKRQFQALSLLATGSFRSKIALDSQDAFELVSDGVTNVLNDIFSDEENKVK